MFDKVSKSYKVILEYQAWIENMFRTLDNKFALGLNGKKLSPMCKTKLFTTSTNYLLYNYAIYNGQELYNTWLPPWVGRFYIDTEDVIDDKPIEDYQAKQVKYIIFVWTWLGSQDEYVADKDEPECFIGIVEPNYINSEARLYDVADNIWKCIRIEKDAEKESDEWIMGSFLPNTMGSNLNGFWQVKRFPLKDIYNIYQTYELIVNPLTEKLRKLQEGESIKAF